MGILQGQDSRNSAGKSWRVIGAVAALAILLVGCGTLFPKPVEFFQDKVESVPEHSARENEILRRAALAAKERAALLAKQATMFSTPLEMRMLADDTAELTDSVSLTLGPPKDPVGMDYEAKKLARELQYAVAKLNSRMDEFKESNDENAGKKIEGTGLFQVPYFLWIGIVAVLAFFGLIVVGVLWTALKMYGLSNPPVQLGVSAVQLGAKTMQKAVAEIYEGGNRFRKALTEKIEDPALQKKVWELFVTEQERAQSRDVQNMLQDLKAGDKL